MKLDVPFFRQTSPLNCGPTVLKMVLAYFGKDFPIEVLERETGISEGKGISTILIASAAARLGYGVDFYSMQVTFNKENLKHEFYQKYADINLMKQSEKLIKEAKTAGVKIEEKTVELGELLSMLANDSLLIVLVDWNVVLGNGKGYQGHFVPVVGFDDENVYVHNSGGEEFVKIKRKVFDEARKAKGTDEDVVVIYRS